MGIPIVLAAGKPFWRRGDTRTDDVVVRGGRGDEDTSNSARRRICCRCAIRCKPPSKSPFSISCRAAGSFSVSAAAINRRCSKRSMLYAPKSGKFLPKASRSMRAAWSGATVGGGCQRFVVAAPGAATASTDLGCRIRTQSIAAGRRVRTSLSGLADGIVGCPGSQLCPSRAGVLRMRSRPCRMSCRSCGPCSSPRSSTAPARARVRWRNRSRRCDPGRTARCARGCPKPKRSGALSARRTRCGRRIARYRSELGMTHLDCDTASHRRHRDENALEESIRTLVADHQ